MNNLIEKHALLDATPFTPPVAHLLCMDKNYTDVCYLRSLSKTHLKYIRLTIITRHWSTILKVWCRAARAKSLIQRRSFWRLTSWPRIRTNIKCKNILYRHIWDTLACFTSCMRNNNIELKHHILKFISNSVSYQDYWYQ